jgi:cytosine/adenosine deaminase-related metal-dependent hydrolase
VRGAYVVTDPSRLPAGGLVEDGAVAVEGGEVAAVGAAAELRSRYPGAEEIGGDGHVVVPGLVNTHHHGWGLSPLQLGLLDDQLETWLPALWQLKVVDAYLDTLWADMRNIRSGVTTLLHAGVGRDWSNYAGETRAKLRAHEDSGIRAAYAVHAMDQNTFVYSDDDAFLTGLPGDLGERVRAILGEMGLPGASGFARVAEELVARYDGHPRLSIMLCPLAPYWCSDDLLRDIRRRATGWGVGIHLHCLESPFQREAGRRMYGMGTIEHLDRLGFLGPDVSLGHSVWMTEREMDVCAATGTSVCHNAASNLRLRVGILPAARLLEKGVNVSIGMDGTTLGDDEDMLAELRLVANLHRLPRGLEPTSCPSSFDVLRMGTVNGARTLGMQSTIGTLEPGRRADIVLVDRESFSRPYMDPRVHIVDALLYRARAMDVDTVIIDGEVVLRDRRFVALDENDILDRLVASAEAEDSPLEARWRRAVDELRPHIARFYERWETPAYEPCYAVNSLR